MVKLRDLKPSPENELLYRPILEDDPGVISLAGSIKKNGVQEPLIITKDNFIVSGHRRTVAARLANLRFVPCRRLASRKEEYPDFLQFLRECNLQRVKSRDELLHEEVVSIDVSQAHEALTEFRSRKRKVAIDAIEVREKRARCVISEAKAPLLCACKKVITDLEDYWPLADRQIHYQLLNNPPLIHASKPASRYKNDKASYKALVDILTRARHAGLIAYEVIADTTRPVTAWTVFPHVGTYTQQQLNEFLNDYWRDLMQSQPNHIEIVAEKLTVETILRPIAANFCIPLTIGRGFCSTRPLHDIAKRFIRSGRDSLIVLSVSDLDPDGDEITHSIGRRLRDDFQLANVQTIKVALTRNQVANLNLPPNSERAKPSSTNYQRFVQRYGSDLVYELEAIPPASLARLLTETIDSVIDVAAFNSEVEQERKDAAHIAAVRARVLRVLEQSGELR